ncbi:PHP domain-like protein [Basidiobolus meristosporus CBS 931.73]|uniref:PHP domain-like protein n=1 Tax=Basidiobolus meristosporus CBS 931.73 TaxID=1314790 RepID=A0A1Y1ZB72_9FUNG|nr:PHP domain-like protein [Basidiobolus meristosporus CBS 931.73]|eukprot:ORY07436.1 PHP domain-like protein [Basidiobolus meristosporus CBS 931.73]
MPTPSILRIKLGPRTRSYLLSCGCRALTITFSLIFLITFVTLVKYHATPSSEDYSKLTFDWKVDPSKYLRTYDRDFGSYNIIMDGHTHTVYSDGRLTPEQIIQLSIANGYNAIVVSDHNTIDGGLEAQRIAQEKYKDQIIVIPAQEYSSCRIHMNFLNINETIPFGPPFPTNEDLRKAIDRVHELGGLAVVNHIPWSNATTYGYQVATLPNHPSREELMDMGIDGIEVINGNTFDLQSLDFVEEHPNRFFTITGGDVHYPGAAYAWTVMKTANFSAASIIEELKNRRTSFLFDPTGTRPRVYAPMNPAFKRIAPLTYLGNYFGNFYDDNRGMYSFQGSFCQPSHFTVHKSMFFYFVLYALAFFLTFEVTRAGVIAISIFGGNQLRNWYNKHRGRSTGRGIPVPSEDHTQDLLLQTPDSSRPASPASSLPESLTGNQPHSPEERV